MSILVDRSTRLLVQGITGREGSLHARNMAAFGTAVVAGVSPGKGGTSVEGTPVFDTVRAAVRERGANASVVFVPATFAADALLEAAAAGIELIVAITEGMPVHDTMVVANRLLDSGVTLVGPNCPGLVTPGQANVGIIPGDIVMPGPVGLVSRSGTLTYEVLSALTARGIGQSTAVGIGGDPVQGCKFVDILRLFEADPDTRLIVLIGEIGGNDEEEAAAFIADQVATPVIAFIAGQTAPEDKRMGHAGAIVSGGRGTAAEKVAALQHAGVTVARHPDEIGDLVARCLAV